MKNYSIIAAVWILLLGNASLAYAQQCVSLTKAMQIAAWGVHVNDYDQGDRSCTACASKYPNGMPGATIPGPPNVTGECSSYDCSSFTTWILRQIAGQTAVPPYNEGPPNTYAMWGSQSIGPRATGAPSGWQPCDPTKQPVCVGMTEWGESGMGGPGHVVTELCGKVYSASPPIYDHYATPQPGTTQGSGAQEIVWLTPPGLASLGMNSCSAQCTSTSASAYSAPLGLGGANPSGLTNATSDPSNSNMMAQMLPMMMMMSMMGPMMSMMGGMGGMGGLGGMGAMNNQKAANNNPVNNNPVNPVNNNQNPVAQQNVLPAQNNLAQQNTPAQNASSPTGSGSEPSGSTANATAAASATTGNGSLLTVLVAQLESMLTSMFNGLSNSNPPAAVPASATPTSAVVQQLEQLEAQQAAQQAAAQEQGAAATGQPAAVYTDPTQDTGNGGDRLSCFALGNCNAASGSSH